jgi:hypothetical protein
MAGKPLQADEGCGIQESKAGASHVSACRGLHKTSTLLAAADEAGSQAGASQLKPPDLSVRDRLAAHRRQAQREMGRRLERAAGAHGEQNASAAR